MKQFVDWVGAMPERRSLSSTDGLFRFLSGPLPLQGKATCQQQRRRDI